jgi:hypothetical protein
MFVYNFATLSPLSSFAFGGLRVCPLFPRFFTVFLCSLPDLKIEKIIDDESKDGMGLSCSPLREAVAL